MANLTKDEIKHVIVNEPDRVTYQNTLKNIPHFALVYVDGIQTTFAKCQQCQDVYLLSYKKKNGYSKYHDHTDKCHPDIDRGKHINKNDLDLKVESSEESSSDDDVSDFEKDAKKTATVMRYPPRPKEEIVAALEEIAAKEGAAEENGQKSNPRIVPTWNYFKPKGQNELGSPLFACVFCTYSGVKNITIFTRHILECCGGCPREIKDSLKKVVRERKNRERSSRKRGRPLGRRSKRPRNSDDDSTRDTDDGNLGDEGNLETNQIVTILSKLLGTPPSAESMATANSQVDEGMKKPLDKFTDADYDREIKELTVKKLRAELKEIEERTVNMRVIRKESEERTQLYRKINHDFDKLIKFVDLVVRSEGQERRDLIGTFVGRLANGDGVAFPSLLEEAFAETISGSNN